ncbi:MAG: 50S ribosomal protein L25 [Pseudomonadota bacterium]
MNRITLEVDRRTGTGKGPCRRLRQAGKVPAIFYGKRSEPIALTVDAYTIKKAMGDQGGANFLFELVINDDTETARKTALLKSRQINPLDTQLIHIDFIEVFKDEAIEVTVPLEFFGKSIGVEKGGTFQIVSRELTISCLPDSIPDTIKVDIADLDLGHALHVSNLTLPEGVKVQDGLDLALAICQAPKSEEPAGEAAAAE